MREKKNAKRRVIFVVTVISISTFAFMDISLKQEARFTKNFLNSGTKLDEKNYKRNGKQFRKFFYE